MSKPDIFDLQSRARAENLRNRVVAVGENIPATIQIPAPPEGYVRGIDICINEWCDSILVISDGYRCRQCVLEGRFPWMKKHERMN